MSDSRTATIATGRLTVKLNSNTGEPSNSSRSGNGSLSNVKDPPSSLRWSYGRSGGALYDVHFPANCPTDRGDCTVNGGLCTGSPGCANRFLPSGYRVAWIRSLGQLGSPTQRPGRFSYAVDGGTVSCIQMLSPGSSVAPLSVSSLSQWSHQATTSCRKPMAGPGWPRCGYLWLHGPISPLVGTSSSLSSRSEERRV